MRRTVTSIALSTLAAGTGVAGFPAAASAADTEPANEVIIVQPFGGPCSFAAVDSTALDVTASGTDTSLQLSSGASSMPFTVLLTPPTGGKLTAGTTYSGVKIAADATSAGVYISTFGTTGLCNPQTGSLTVDQIHTDAGGTVTALEARLDLSTAGDPRDVRVLIRYNATGPAPAGSVTGRPPTTPAGTAGPVGFVSGGRVVLNAGSGTSGASPAAVFSPPDADGQITPRAAAWSPMGNRIVYAAPDGLHAVHPDGSGDERITAPPNGATNSDVNPAMAADGTIVFQRDHRIYVAALDPETAGYEFPLTLLGANTKVASPAFAPDGSLLFTKVTESTGYPHPETYDLYRWNGGTPTLVLADAAEPAASPDGTHIAFTRWDEHGVRQVFTVGADGVSGLTQLTHGETDAGQPAWSTDGRTIAYRSAQWDQVVELPAGGGAPVGGVPGARAPFFQPRPTTVAVHRVWGADRIQTALAASRHDFAAHGAADRDRDQAKAVVLARSDTFADALGGSSLAVRKDAPLLITDSHALDGGVAAELQRVLAPGGTVYLLGGDSALSPAVEQAVRRLHYTVTRLAGADRYATSVQIAKAVDPNPKTLLIASGDNFPDALAAGATGLPLVLTAGSSMPTATANYLNYIDPITSIDGPSVTGTTQLVTVGGPGDAALISGFRAGKMPRWGSELLRVKLVGATRNDTALLVARTFFAAESEAAFATSATWPDALSGGAMVGHRGGPLLLTDPTGLYGPAADFLSARSDTLLGVDVLGGTAALPGSISAQIAARIGTPGHVVVDQAHGAPLPAGTRPTGVTPEAATRD